MVNYYGYNLYRNSYDFSPRYTRDRKDPLLLPSSKPCTSTDVVKEDVHVASITSNNTILVSAHWSTVLCGVCTSSNRVIVK